MARDRYRSEFHQAFSWPVMRNALIVGLVVGTILNLINQGDKLGGHGSIDWLKVGLTYIVPFCVSTWGSYVAIRAFNRTGVKAREAEAER